MLKQRSSHHGTQKNSRGNVMSQSLVFVASAFSTPCAAAAIRTIASTQFQPQSNNDPSEKNGPNQKQFLT
ncbi:MAG: hypothetical protein CL681_01710 [Blastopirellula sp.]|nr:hypothetical protein [Blastopirellula sp.]|tara:strand:- start:2402 stop:2611 length:210 start_codon:yes stop_codon:yes gene_type:complete